MQKLQPRGCSVCCSNSHLQQKNRGVHDKKGSNNPEGDPAVPVFASLKKTRAVAHLSCVEELTLHIRVPVTDRGDRLHFGHQQVLYLHAARQPTCLAAAKA